MWLSDECEDCNDLNEPDPGSMGFGYRMCDKCTLSARIEEIRRKEEDESRKRKLQGDKVALKAIFMHNQSQKNQIDNLFNIIVRRGHTANYIYNVWSFYQERGYLTEKQVDKLLEIIFDA